MSNYSRLFGKQAWSKLNPNIRRRMKDPTLAGDLPCPMKGEPMPLEKGLHVAKVVEITAESTKSFEDAIAMGVDRATKTLKNVQGAWVKGQQVVVRDGKIAVFRVNLKVTFLLME
jgi:flavin-binding protein dodecin